jgi:hypothetical protein
VRHPMREPFNMANGIQFGILEHEQVRLILVDRVEGGTLLISIEDADGIDVTRLRAESQPVVDSIRVVAPLTLPT